MIILQWRRSFFHSFATKEVSLSRWLVVVAMLVVDGRGNDTHGLWLAGDHHRERERETSWSTTKWKERSIEIGEEINWNDTFYFATS